MSLSDTFALKSEIVKNMQYDTLTQGVMVQLNGILCYFGEISNI